jgi:hypothetical protein
MKSTETSERKCESCQQPIAVPASAVHKRFCNTHCRNQWHKQQRSQGLQLLKQQQATGPRQ